MQQADNQFASERLPQVAKLHLPERQSPHHKRERLSARVSAQSGHYRLEYGQHGNLGDDGLEAADDERGQKSCAQVQIEPRQPPADHHANRAENIQVAVCGKARQSVNIFGGFVFDDLHQIVICDHAGEVVAVTHNRQRHQFIA